MQWYLRSEAEEDDSPYLFPLLLDVVDRRANYQVWLREVTRAAIPEAAEFIHLIRPHGLRAGWATDRSRQDIPSHTIAAEGRWNDVTAMMKYIRTVLKDVIRTGSFRAMTAAMRVSYPFAETF